MTIDELDARLAELRAEREALYERDRVLRIEASRLLLERERMVRGARQAVDVGGEP